MAIMTDGYQTTIAFTSAQIGSGVVISNIMEEKEVPPPGIAGGGANDASTMRNTQFRTMVSKTLITLSPFTLVVAYDPALYDQMMAMINDNQEMTVTFPDGAELVFWGWVDDFSPNAHVEGAQPTANVIIIPSNRDGDGAEVGPNYTAP